MATAELVGRLAAGEQRIEALGVALEEHRREIAAQNDRHRGLISDLSAAFDRQATELNECRERLEEQG